jgi:ribonuclease BN (tRNA processing enzyme)
VLGCGDAFGSGGRYHACFLLESPTGRVLVDAGASALIAMNRFRVDPSTIDAVVLSHLHGDHFGGLPFILLDALFVRPRPRPLLVVGPRGVAARVRKTMELMFPGSWGRNARCVRFAELVDRRRRRVAGIDVTPFTVIHMSGAPAFALRMAAGGCTVAYSGDTEWTDALLEAANGADLFLCEASSFDRAIPYHLTYASVKSNANAFGASRIVLTHLGPDVLARRSALSFECARDGQRFVIRPRVRRPRAN